MRPTGSLFERDDAEVGVHREAVIATIFWLKTNTHWKGPATARLPAFLARLWSSLNRPPHHILAARPRG